MASMEQGVAQRRVPGLGRSFLYLVAGAGTVAAFARFALGLGATTNLNDGYPWGLWITFDVLAGVALAAGGFTISAIIYVLALKEFEPLLRPAKLSAFVGYLLAVLGIMFDIGFPWRIWHPIFMWNTSSVLFEVSWCVMVYTAVLGVDMLILLLEKLGRTRWLGLLRSVYVVAVVLGLVLSALHQSSLGALFLVIPQKMSDLWATRAAQVFMTAYLETAGEASFVPADRTDLRLLLRSYAILKAMYELRYELNNRPKWTAIPLRGLLQLAAKKAPAALVTA